MDSRIAALRAHVKERGTSNSKAGPTLTFYIRSGPVRAVSVVSHTHTHTHKSRRRTTHTRTCGRRVTLRARPFSFGDRCRARRTPTATSSFTIRRSRGGSLKFRTFGGENGAAWATGEAVALHRISRWMEKDKRTSVQGRSSNARGGN